MKFKIILIATDFLKDFHYCGVPVHAKAHLLHTAWQEEQSGTTSTQIYNLKVIHTQ